MTGPSVTIAIPTFNEERHIETVLRAVDRQTYQPIVEVLVVDGRSTDRTRELAGRCERVLVLDNPKRAQAAALNIALRHARGDILVRLDGHCEPAADYVERCVDALESTGATLVGGAMTPIAGRGFQRGIAAAMRSPLGVGPARFHTGGPSGWVDTVYLGAGRTEALRALGGYAEDVGVNEDAELAYRARRARGVWFDSSIHSTYVPRGSIPALARQFHRYGASRAATVRKHPASLAPRQLVAPLLVIALLSPYRRQAVATYVGILYLAAVRQAARDPAAVPAMVAVLPAMHLPWGLGFIQGLLKPASRPERAR